MSLLKEYFYNIKCDVCGCLCDNELWHTDSQGIKEIADESKYCQFCGSSQETVEVTGIVKKSTEQTLSEMKEQIAHGQETGKLYLIIGWVSMVVSLVFVPVAFGAVAVIMGYLYRDKDEKMGTVLMIAGVSGAILGVLLGMSMSY